MLTTYEVIRKRSNLVDLDQDQENKEEEEVVDKVVKKRMIILRPHQLNTSFFSDSSISLSLSAKKQKRII
jgi:hypothetical protein